MSHLEAAHISPMMEKDPDLPKQLIMYSNDAVEATFIDGTKIFLAPCATEYVIQQGNHSQGVMTTKHRTIYTTSTLLPRIRSILTFRNLYAQQPFLVPALVDSSQCYQSTGTATHVRWSPNSSLPLMDADDPSQTWSWTSLCGRARIDIPACRQIVFVTHPLQVSRVLTKADGDTDIPTKYIHIFAPVRRCFSAQRLPNYLASFVNKCLQLLEHLSTGTFDSTSSVSGHGDDWSFKLPLPLPSTSCPKAHRHRLHHQMMLEADLRILQTGALTYRLEYDHPSSIEALVMDEEQQLLTEYVLTNEIQSSFYHYYSIKDQRCQLLTLSEHSLPPHNERLIQIIRFMSTMRQRLLTMTRRVQEQPCWSPDDDSATNETAEDLKTSSWESEIDTDDNDDSPYRQTAISEIGHFKYFLDDRVYIQFYNGFILHMTPAQVQFCQANSHINIQCRITDRKKRTTIDIIDGRTQPGCYEQYITAALDWCLWVANEKRLDAERQAAANIEEELFQLKLYRNRIEIDEYQQSTTPTRAVTDRREYYSPEDIKQLLQRTAQFTRTPSS